MIEERRHAYLRAMGLDVWLPRLPAAGPDRLGIRRGSDGTLLLVSTAGDCRTELAGDLARALGGDPGWAWLDPAADEEAQTLQEVVAECLITRILVFGPDTARRAFGGDIPLTLGSATVVALPGLHEVAASGSARQALWAQLRAAQAVPQEWS